MVTFKLSGHQGVRDQVTAGTGPSMEPKGTVSLRIHTLKSLSLEQLWLEWKSPLTVSAYSQGWISDGMQ